MAAKSKSTQKIKRPKAPSSGKKRSAVEAELDVARSTIKKLKATVRLLEKNVAKADKKAEGLKREVKKVKKTKKPVESIVEHNPAAEHEPAAPEPAVAPTSDLTVAQLRAAAREQGVPGYSRMRKEQLNEALA